MTNIWTYVKHAVYGVAGAVVGAFFNAVTAEAEGLTGHLTGDWAVLYGAVLAIAIPYVQKAEADADAWINSHDPAAGGDTPNN